MCLSVRLYPSTCMYAFSILSVSIYMSFCLCDSLYLSVLLCDGLSLNLYLSVCPYICLVSLFLFVCVCLAVNACLSVYIALLLSVYLTSSLVEVCAVSVRIWVCVTNTIPQSDTGRRTNGAYGNKGQGKWADEDGSGLTRMGRATPLGRWKEIDKCTSEVYRVLM
jgi:hypothetical protein